jgi:hypothetical protein
MSPQQHGLFDRERCAFPRHLHTLLIRNREGKQRPHVIDVAPHVEMLTVQRQDFLRNGAVPPVPHNKIEGTAHGAHVIAQGSQSKMWRMALLPGWVGASAKMLAIMQQMCEHGALTATECLKVSLCLGMLRQVNEFAIGHIIQIGE